jgi:hypothetical protein
MSREIGMTRKKTERLIQVISDGARALEKHLDDKRPSDFIDTWNKAELDRAIDILKKIHQTL